MDAQTFYDTFKESINNNFIDKFTQEAYELVRLELKSNDTPIICEVTLIRNNLAQSSRIMNHLQFLKYFINIA